MVRPNSVIPMGKVDSRPDYDYTDGVELHVFRPTAGELTVTIPDLNGETAAVYTLETKNGRVSVKTDSTKPYSVIVHR